ncbi:MAG: hypothetical protein SGI74_11445 [Oligoflexia bacterium]|nr:hypothetical protein [Oligoflexia bacterium]
MKTKIWNHEQLIESYPAALSLKDVLAQFNIEADSDGHVVCEVSVNGIVLDEETEIQFGGNALSEIQTISVKTQDPLILLDESLVSSNEYINRILIALEHSSQLFRSEAIHEAHTYYRGCVEGTQWFIEMITHYKSAYQGLKGTLSANWLELEQAMILVLEQIFDAYKEKNYILVADLLEYDLITIFHRWQQELSQSGNSRNSGQRAGSESVKEVSA